MAAAGTNFVLLKISMGFPAATECSLQREMIHQPGSAGSCFCTCTPSSGGLVQVISGQNVGTLPPPNSCQCSNQLAQRQTAIFLALMIFTFMLDRKSTR